MVFLELRRDSRVTTGNSGCLLCWPREVQSSIRVVEESWGLLSSDGNMHDPIIICLLALGLFSVGKAFPSFVFCLKKLLSH